jgi:TetR/AcrR family transcriptional regulator
MAAAALSGGRAEKTRQAILEAAERLFAERGFAATRLEDIAEQVGIRRASMVYHFKDKRELHTAVISSVLQGLDEAIRSAASPDLQPRARIEAAVGAWVDYVGTRPTTARLLLRELANAGHELPKALLVASRPLAQFIRDRFLDDASVRTAVRSTGDTKIDPLHVASALAGATLFFVAAAPVVATRPGFDPLDEAHIEAHKEELLRIVRQLLRFDVS